MTGPLLENPDDKDPLYMDKFQIYFVDCWTLHLGKYLLQNGLNFRIVQNVIAGPVLPFFLKKSYWPLRNGGARMASANRALSARLIARYSSTQSFSTIHRRRPLEIHSMANCRLRLCTFKMKGQVEFYDTFTELRIGNGNPT